MCWLSSSNPLWREREKKPKPIFLELAGKPELRFRLVTLPPSREKPGMVLPAGWKCYSIAQTTQHQKTKRQNSLCSVWLMMPVSAMYVGRGNYCTHRHIWLVIFLLQQWKGEKRSKKTFSQHLEVSGSSTGFQQERHPQYLFFQLAHLIRRIKSLQMQK